MQRSAQIKTQDQCPFELNKLATMHLHLLKQQISHDLKKMY
uniref:Uncharacterized protein n=1 Tax=Rhizophora mucronata TaxID=61149 RepID=A0A2P2R3D6_RHIMU